MEMFKMSHLYPLVGEGLFPGRKENYFWYILKAFDFFAFNFLIHDMFALIMIAFSLLANDVVMI